MTESARRREPELLIDVITSLDGYASAEGWPGWWGREGPEYLRWLDHQPEKSHRLLMGTTTYTVMSGMSRAARDGEAGISEEEAETLVALDDADKVVVSSSLEEPLGWPHTELVRDDAAAAVRRMKAEGQSLRTLGSLDLCRSLMAAGVVDRLRLVIFPVITGVSGRERIFDGFGDVALTMLSSRLFDGRLQMVEYAPRPLPQ